MSGQQLDLWTTWSETHIQTSRGGQIAKTGVSRSVQHPLVSTNRAHILGRVASRDIDESRLQVPVPEEPVVALHAVESISSRSRKATNVTHSLPKSACALLLLQPVRDVVSAVGEVEGSAEEVRLEQSQEVRLVGLSEEGRVACAVDGEDGEVGRSVHGRREDRRDLVAVRDHDEVVG